MPMHLKRREYGAMPMRGVYRLRTLEALFLLPIARLLVDHVPMKHWRRTLGTMVKSGHPEFAQASSSESAQVKSRHLASRVERAAGRLPFHTKCLPRAIALHWMLRRRNVDAQLVIAIYKGPDRSLDEYHAWVESGDEIVLGHCDRQFYRPLMTFANLPAGPLPRAEG